MRPQVARPHAAGGPSFPRGRQQAVRFFALFLLGVFVVTTWPGTVTASAASSRTALRPSVTTGSPSVVATARGTIVSLYQSPSARKPYAVLHNPTSSGGPLVFLASDLALAPYWVRVYLPMRPNGSQAWVNGSAVQLSSDSYLVRVQLSAHHLVVYHGARAIVTVPVGVGRSVLPTPTGTYFLAMLLKQPDPSGLYGPYAFGLSAFSNELYSFGGGPGEIGLHGTDEPSSVGANVSHGCLRVTDATITELARLLPLGTPVTISP